MPANRTKEEADEDRTDDARDDAGDRSLHLARGACDCQPAGRKPGGRLRAGSAGRPRWRPPGRPIRPAGNQYGGPRARRAHRARRETSTAHPETSTKALPGISTASRATTARRADRVGVRRAVSTDHEPTGHRIRSRPLAQRGRRPPVGGLRTRVRLDRRARIHRRRLLRRGPGTAQRSRSERLRASDSCSVAGRCRAGSSWSHSQHSPVSQR